jgi:hypothetical protein
MKLEINKEYAFTAGGPTYTGIYKGPVNLRVMGTHFEMTCEHPFLGHSLNGYVGFAESPAEFCECFTVEPTATLNVN